MKQLVRLFNPYSTDIVWYHICILQVGCQCCMTWCDFPALIQGFGGKHGDGMRSLRQTHIYSQVVGLTDNGSWGDMAAGPSHILHGLCSLSQPLHITTQSLQQPSLSYHSSLIPTYNPIPTPSLSLSVTHTHIFLTTICCRILHELYLVYNKSVFEYNTTAWEAH